MNFSETAQFHKKNRENVTALLSQHSCAVIHSNDTFPSSADATLPFFQNTNFYYLTGIIQEESILLLAPHHPNKDMREVLFLKKTNETIKVWEGNKLSKREAANISGIANVMWVEEFTLILHQVMMESENLYLESNEHLRNSTKVKNLNDRRIKKYQKKYPLHQFKRLSPLINELRKVKSAIEIKSIQHACDITALGFREILKYIKPNIWEYQIEAKFLHSFMMNKSKRFAYTPIIASGENTCVLHYTSNDKQLKDKDLLLLDVGAEYENYHADTTRTFPINGTFSPRQKQIYRSVLTIKNKATQLLKPGITIPEYHQYVGEIMEKELLDLQLISKKDIQNQNPKYPAYKKYFMHGTSHHLGLDVHDVGSIYTPLKENMVLTVEPGIYIPEEKIGIRLEDVVLLTQNTPKNLTEKIPIEIEEIEELMH